MNDHSDGAEEARGQPAGGPKLVSLQEVSEVLETGPDVLIIEKQRRGDAVLRSKFCTATIPVRN